MEQQQRYPLPLNARFYCLVGYRQSMYGVASCNLGSHGLTRVRTSTVRSRDPEWRTKGQQMMEITERQNLHASPPLQKQEYLVLHSISACDIFKIIIK
jgi:hypothetical protein